MKCPRCDYEWDVRQSPCPRCHLHLQMGARPRAINRTSLIQESSSDASVASPPPSGRERYAARWLEPAAAEQAQLQLSARLNDLHVSNPPITDRLERDGSQILTASESSLSDRRGVPSATSSPSGIQHPLPGTFLHRNRYSIQRSLSKRTWPLGIVESMWTAQDTRLAKSEVVIHELSVPHSAPREVQSLAYTATKVFTAIGRDLHVQPLRDVFSEQGRSYFVFEAAEGLPLPTLMFNNGGTLAEQEVIACCLQMAELLDMCSNQSPPLVHGNIRPEYIVQQATTSQYVLTRFSVALAGGLAEIIANMRDSGSFSYVAGEQFVGTINGSADLSALLEIAYYAMTGRRTSPSAMQDTLASLSSPLRTIFMKGLFAPPQQRYQTPAQLAQDLLLLHNRYRSVVIPPQRPAVFEPALPSAPVAVQAIKDQVSSESLQALVSARAEQAEQVLLVPLPEELPPLKAAPDLRNAMLWFAGMLFLLVLLLGRGLF